MSLIDATFPATGVAVAKATERANWTAAKSEIERLQAIWVNVKDYGAVGDGSTDDTTAINSAIAAINGLSDYAVLYFPKSGGFRVYGSTPLTALLTGYGVQMDSPIIYNVGGSPLVTTFLWTIGITGGWNPGGSTQGGGGLRFDLWFETMGSNNYAVNTGLAAVRFYNLVNSTVILRKIGAFTNGVQLAATASHYCTGNKFYMGRFSNQVGLELLADGAGAWIIHNEFHGGGFGHDAPDTLDKTGVRARAINGALAMHSLKFYGTDIELGNNGTHRSAAFETVGNGVTIYAYDLYLESNTHLLYNTDGSGYVGVTYVRGDPTQLVVSEGAFSGSRGLSQEQAHGGSLEVAGTGARTLGQSDIGSTQRLTSGTATWTINKFYGRIVVDNIDGGTLTLAAGTGVTLSASSIAAGKVATLLGRVSGTKVQVLLEN